MRRKLVKQGRNALTVTLPSKWTQRYGLKAGDEVEINEHKDKITISSTKFIEENTASLSFKDYLDVLDRMVGATYKAGYDKVEIFYEKPEQVDIVRQVVGKTCMGFEITEQTKDKIEIRTLLKTSSKEFEVVLRRCFLNLISIGEDSIKAIESKDEAEIRKVILRDMEINKYCDFCRRILNKGADLSYDKLAPLYAIIEELEKIGDMYRDILKIILAKEIDIGEKTIKLYEQTNEYFRQLYDLFYKFSIEKVNGFISEKKKIYSYFERNITNIKKEEYEIFYNLLFLGRQIYDLNGPIMTLQDFS